MSLNQNKGKKNLSLQSITTRSKKKKMDITKSGRSDFNQLISKYYKQKVFTVTLPSVHEIRIRVHVFHVAVNEDLFENSSRYS